MTWTQEDLDRLDTAIAAGSGVQTMTFKDQSITFTSLEEKLKLRSVMVQELAAASGSPKGYRLAATSKGV